MARASLTNRALALAHRRYSKRLRELHELTYIFWEATLRCNLVCRHCGSSCVRDAQGEELDTREVEKVFSSIADAYPAERILVAITGGEPLVRKDLFTVMGHLQQLGFNLGMVSNGIAINQQVAERLDDHGLKTISISIDGLEKTHDFIRNKKGAFRKAMRALDILSRHQRMASEALSVVTGYNLGELEGLRDELIRRGIRRWRLETVIPIGRAAADPRFCLNRAQTRQLLDFIAAARTDGALPVSFGCEGWLGLEYERRVRDRFFFCHAGVSVASVLANGDISACPDLRDRFVQGNVRRDDFVEVWEDRFEAYRQRDWMHTSLCADCDAWKDCQGGAMHNWTESGEKLGCIYRILNDD